MNRETVMASVRRALGATGTEAPRITEVEHRLATRPRGVIPARGLGDQAAREARFIEMARFASATVTRIASLADLPQAVADYLRAENLPALIRQGGDTRFEALDWAATALTVETGTGPTEDGRACLSHADAGVAETGTLVLTSGPGTPTSLNFLADTHIVALNAATIAGDYESVWETLRTRFGENVLPRTVNWITGPSRSADIEQKLLMGAHGPRRLHVVIYG